MNKQLIETWITKLEDGSYRQARKQLRKNSTSKKEGTSYCCLGVLCNIIQPTAWRNNHWKDATATDIPTQVREFLEEVKLDETWLVSMNDNGQSFKQIAAYIKQNAVYEY